MNKKTDYIIFRVYRNSLDGEYHDFMVDAYTEIVKKLKAVAKIYHKELILLSNFADHAENIIVNTPYLEVLYSGELLQEEKEVYLNIAKRLFSENDYFDIDSDKNEEYIPKIVVRFSKLSTDDCFEVIEKENCDNISLVLKSE